MQEDRLRKIPKIELHCHLDGSLSREFIQKRLGRKVSLDEICVSDDCASLEEYLKKFDLPCACLTEAENLEEAGYDVLSGMSEENICYAEIRFAPLLSATEHLPVAQVIQALLRGLDRGRKEFGIQYNVIVCAMRHHAFGQNMQMIEEASRFLGNGVCAADLAGAEAAYPMSQFMELFRRVKELGMPFTIHAGECGDVQNIMDAIDAGASRIGHGIAMKGNHSVQKMVREGGIGVEMCPLSNLQTKAVRCPAEYPLREFLQAGILVTINTDNRTVSNSSMTKELSFIQKTYEVTDDEIYGMMRNAAEVAFLADEEKSRLKLKLAEGFR